jgi:hypothetical protein
MTVKKIRRHNEDWKLTQNYMYFQLMNITKTPLD